MSTSDGSFETGNRSGDVYATAKQVGVFVACAVPVISVARSSLINRIHNDPPIYFIDELPLALDGRKDLGEWDSLSFIATESRVNRGLVCGLQQRYGRLQNLARMIMLTERGTVTDRSLVAPPGIFRVLASRFAETVATGGERKVIEQATKNPLNEDTLESTISPPLNASITLAELSQIQHIINKL